MKKIVIIALMALISISIFSQDNINITEVHTENFNIVGEKFKLKLQEGVEYGYKKKKHDFYTIELREKVLIHIKLIIFPNKKEIIKAKLDDDDTEYLITKIGNGSFSSYNYKGNNIWKSVEDFKKCFYYEDYKKFPFLINHTGNYYFEKFNKEVKDNSEVLLYIVSLP